MKCLTSAESACFLNDFECLTRDSVATTHSLKQPIVRRRIDANIEQWTSGKVPCLARSLSHWLWRDDHLSPDSQVFVNVFEWSIWSSSEDWNLYSAWRLARAGERRPIQDAPGHLFMQFERHDCASLLFMGLTYGWGLSCISLHCARAFHVDHDGHGLFVAWAESELDSGTEIYGHSPPPNGVRTPAP